jgi:RNA polymerase sigma-70 factor (ECF subfamily)
MPSLAEKRLIESIKEGDFKSYELLFKSYYSSLCKYARSLVHNGATAEDIVMDLFIKLWESQDKLLINTSLNAYLFRSVHNRCMNYLTRTSHRFSNLDDETIEKLNKLVSNDSINVPSAEYNTIELIQEIDSAIEKLPEECRRIFIMSRTEELSHKEIAEKLNLSVNTVKVQIYRALIKMREHLKDFLPFL